MRIRYRKGTYTNGIPDVAFIEQADVPDALVDSRLRPIEDHLRLTHLEELMVSVLRTLTSEQLAVICREQYYDVED